jgi:hypothetical protein
VHFDRATLRRAHDVDNSAITAEILKNIRAELREGLQGVNHRLDGLSHHVHGIDHRLDGIDHRLDGIDHRLNGVERRQVESEVRISTELVALAGVVREVRDAIRDDRVLRARVEDHEVRITALENPRG